MPKKKRLHAIRLTPAMLKEEQQRAPTIEDVAESYNNAGALVLDSVLTLDAPAARAAMMIATCAFSILSGRQSFHQFEIVQSTHVLIDLWKIGSFTPPEHYPFSLEQTIAALQYSSPSETPGEPDYVDVEIALPVEAETAQHPVNLEDADALVQHVLYP